MYSNSLINVTSYHQLTIESIKNITISMFVFLLIILPFRDVFGYRLVDMTLPLKPQEESQYTYEKCLSLRKIFYEDQCWDLLTKGPCDNGQWLVLDWSGDDTQRRQREPMRAKCTKRRCSDSDVYWPWDGFCYDAETARRRQLCPRPNTELATDEFGDGYCECTNAGKVPYVRVVFADEDSEPCYPMYARGPCPKGEILTPFGWGYGNCTVDKCAAEQQRDGDSSPFPQSRWLQRPIMAPWVDGRCYELGTRGPCAGNEQFAVRRDVMRLGCVSPVTELDLFSNKKTTTPCKTDHRGVCVDAVDLLTNDTSFGFEAQLLESAKRHDNLGNKKKKRTP